MALVNMIHHGRRVWFEDGTTLRYEQSHDESDEEPYYGYRYETVIFRSFVTRNRLEWLVLWYPLISSFTLKCVLVGDDSEEILFYHKLHTRECVRVLDVLPKLRKLITHRQSRSEASELEPELQFNLLAWIDYLHWSYHLSSEGTFYANQGS
jgi:hypothetical protein